MGRPASVRSLWQVTAVMIAICAGVAAISLVGTDWLQKMPVLGQLVMFLPVAIRGLPGSPPDGFHPNSVAGTLVWVIPLLIALATVYRGRPLPVFSPAWQKIGMISFWVVWVLIIGTFILTQSRGAYLGCGCGLAALLILPRRLWRRIALGAGIVVAIILIILGPQLLEAYRNTEIARASMATSPETLAGRFELWQSVLSLISDFPFTGTGMGTLRKVIPVLYPVLSFSPSEDIGHAHNHLLAAAADLGLPGLIAYLGLWLGAAVMLRAAYIQAPTPDVKLIVLGLGAGLIAHFIFSLTDAIVLGAKPGLLLWLAFGLIAKVYQTVCSEQLAESSNRAALSRA